jgi:hypothetical protein
VNISGDMTSFLGVGSLPAKKSWIRPCRLLILNRDDANINLNQQEYNEVNHLAQITKIIKISPVKEVT